MLIECVSFTVTALLLIGLFLVPSLIHAQPSTPDQKRQTSEYSLPPEKLKQAIEYSHARNWLAFGGAIYGIAALVVVLQWGLSAKFRDWAEAASRRRFVQALGFVPPLPLAIALFRLPLGLYGH